MKNILIIICDQLSPKALRTYGSLNSDTPSIDRLAEEGIVFEQAYTPCPLCQPARAAFWSSSYPHQNGVVSNLPRQAQAGFPRELRTLGEIFKEGGYECVHFGKEHDYGALRGFVRVENEQKKEAAEHPAIPYDYETYFDIDTTEKAVRYLIESVPSLQKPFLTVVDLQNPHNICAYIGAHAAGGANHMAESELPPLPENFSDEDISSRASFLQYLCCGHRRQSQTADWSETDFRHYLHAYYYYLKKVDRQIGRVLKALEQSGKAEDTMIVFFADHGEGMAAHKIVTKSGTFYEETVRVPFILTGRALQGKELPRRYDRLFSLLDLLPTLADYADLSVPPNAAGVSHWRALMEIAEGRKMAETVNSAAGGVAEAGRQMTEAEKAELTAPEGRKAADMAADKQQIKTEDYVVSQWHDEFEGYFVPARMYRDKHYKYIAYQDKQGLEEELYDMVEDSLERRNLSALSEYRQLTAEYRQKLEQYCIWEKDPFFSLKPEYSDMYRCHAVGRHSGPNAVLDYQEKINRQRKAGGSQ